MQGTGGMGGLDEIRVKIGGSEGPDPQAAAAELADRLSQPHARFHLVFASSRFDPQALAQALAARLPGAPVLGCTTAGEISPRGFSVGSVVGLSVASARLDSAHALLAPLEGMPLASIREAVARLQERLGPPGGPGQRQFGLVLIDGLSQREELLMAALAAAAPEVRWVGGSAADYDFRAAYILEGGRAHCNAALILILRTDLPVHTIKSEHMLPTNRKTVVTGAVGRCVTELDGKPALSRYAQLIGIPGRLLTRELAGMWPFACRVAGQSFVRSVSGFEDGALRFACAVAPGTVLELMQAGDLVASTREALEAARAAVGEPACVVAFNCLGRFMEAEQRGLTQALGATYAALPVIGFNTYGEQCDGLHMNHTFTGLAIGRRRSE